MIKDFLDSDCISNKSFYGSVKDIVTCNICSGIMINPRECTSCQNSFCKRCIDEWKSLNDSCPYKCENNEFKECSRPLKNLLEKLLFFCPACDKIDKNTNYKTFLLHIKSCDKIKVDCPTCNSTVLRSNLIENKQYLKMKDNYENLFKNYQNLKEENDKLVKELNFMKNSNIKGQRRSSLNQSKNNIFGLSSYLDSNELGIVDKCEHFKGNYIPIFSCCEKSYPCFICHNKYQNHEFIISNKVVCLICKNIYSGPKCDVCNTYQIYRKKD
jgi:hypothetical protein